MLAVGMLRDKPGVHAFDAPVPELHGPDEALIRMVCVGLDGTDYNMVRHNLQDIAPGKDSIIMGHEGVGVVEQVGREVSAVSVGDMVVITVRRGCGECEPCLHNQSDMCLTGKYTERGLHKLDGLLTRLVVEKESYIVKVPEEVKPLAVFAEPLSIIEKGVQQIKIIQSRLAWHCPHDDHGFLNEEWGGCKVALVVGAGPLGLLATAVIRMAGAYVYTSDIVDEDHPKAELVRQMGAEYLDARGKTPAEMVDFCCTPTGVLNVIFEASGAAKTAIELIPFMSRSSIYVVTGIPRGDVKIEVDAAEWMRRVVGYNQVIIGSVNSNRRHFETALKDIGRMNATYHGMLEKMVSRSFRLEEYEKAFSRDAGDHIKTVIRFD